MTIPLMLSVTSCNLDFFPSDAITSEQLAADPSGSVYSTDGNYSMFKDILEYRGTTYSGNSYIRHYFQMTEFQSDNICLSGRTTDPIYEATCYKRDATLGNVTYLWWCAYRIIYGANAVIEMNEDGASDAIDHLRGENYFLRALCHLHLVTLWSKPYSLGRDNLGVVLRTSTSSTETKRATVGEVYDQIVADLLKAIDLMSKGSTRGNAGYVSKAAAQGLLSRVYLYMGENQKVIDTADDMLAGADPSSKLEPTATYSSYFANALTSVETLWAVAHTALETRGQESIGSMYLNDGLGWGEVYSSDPLNDLYDKNPNDLRTSFIKPVYDDTTKWMIRWPVASADDDSRSDEIEVVTKDGTGKYYYTDNSQKIYVQTETVNGYSQNYIILNGEKTRVRLSKKMSLRNSFPLFYVTKFSYQDNDPMLSSPVMIRWAEVILNRAEAYAKIGGKDAEALADVNVIRTRAGLSGTQLFSAVNMQGYSNVLDVVLDERRLELAFEGHRAIDVYRNKLSMDREFAGVQPWEIVDYNDNKIQYYIPVDETSVSGITQNP